MTPNHLLGIDLGTSSTKAVVLAAEGTLSGQASVDYPIEQPHPGWAEQDPEVWYQAVVQAVRAVIAASGISPVEVAAIGLSGQMHGTLCIDGRGQPLRPAIIWADRRSLEQVKRIEKSVGLEKLADWTGNPLATGFMLPTWIWLREMEPEVAAATRSLLLPKDYLRYRLTAKAGSEPSDASSTSMFDPAGRTWCLPLLERLSIDPGLLPALGESTQVAAELTVKAASDTGLRPGIPVVYGGSDQACQAVGHAVINPGRMACTIGTGGQLFAPVSRPAHDPQLRLHLFCHALPVLWHYQAATLSAGLSLKWLRDKLYPGCSFQELADSAARAPAGSEGLLFTPYLAGERTPHMDPLARAGLVGLTLRHGRSHLARAVMEGVVFALRQGLDLMNELGTPAAQIIASGGAAQHQLWLRLQADIFNRPIYRTETVEAAAVGAALLAGVGIGVYSDLENACQRAVKINEEAVLPDPEAVAIYTGLYQQFTGLYPALKEINHTLSGLL